MKIINKNTGFELEVLEREHDLSKEEEKESFVIEDIVQEMYDSWREFPREIRKNNLLDCSYYGTVIDAIEWYDKDYLGFTLKRYVDFTKYSLDEFIYENEKYKLEKAEDEEELNHDFLYVKIDHNRTKESMGFISDFIKKVLKYEHGIEVTDYDSYENCYFSIREKHVLNSWVRLNYRVNYKIVEAVHDKFKDNISNFEHQYVPGSGPSDTVFGELLRCCQRIVYRFFNDGDLCSNIFDGNYMSFINIPYILGDIDDGSDEEKYFVEAFNKNSTGYNFINAKHANDIGDFFYEIDTPEYCIISSIIVEESLIETKMKFPDFLSVKNTYDSRNYL